MARSMRATRTWLWLTLTVLIISFTTRKCSAESLRDYYPLQVGDEWQYIQELTCACCGEIWWVGIGYVDMRITSTETYEGKEYFKISVTDSLYPCRKIPELKFFRYQRHGILSERSTESAESYWENELESKETVWEYNEYARDEYPILFWFPVVRYDSSVEFSIKYCNLLREPPVEVCDSTIEYPISVPAGIFEDIIYCRNKESSTMHGMEQVFFLARNVGMIYSKTLSVFNTGTESGEVWKLTYAKINGVEYGTKHTAVRSSTWGQVKSLFR